MDFELKRWKNIYIDQLQTAADDPGVAIWLDSSFPSPYTLDDAEEYVRRQLCCDDGREYSRAVIVNGQVQGGIAVTVQEGIYSKCADLSFWLASTYWGQGIMTSAVGTVCASAFEQFDIERISAVTFADNVPSRRVLNNCGFTLEGVLRRSAHRNGIIHDCCIYALFPDRD